MQDTYFVQGNKKLPPKGKLWDRYQGRKRSMSKIAQNPKKPKMDSESENMSPVVDQEALEEVRASLKHIRNWQEVSQKWTQTISYRKRQLQNSDMSLQKILEDWPLFKYSRAPELVSI